MRKEQTEIRKEISDEFTGIMIVFELLDFLFARLK